MHWEQSLRIVSSKRNPPLNYNLSMTGNYKCSNTYIELTLFSKKLILRYCCVLFHIPLATTPLPLGGGLVFIRFCQGYFS